MLASESLFVDLYLMVSNPKSSTSTCRDDLLAEILLVRDDLAMLGVDVTVGSSFLEPYPPLLIMSTTTMSGHRLEVMFWERGPRAGMFVLYSADHGLEVGLQATNDNKGWVITVVASMNGTTTELHRNLLGMFRCIVRLRHHKLFSGQLHYNSTVAVMEDRTRLMFGVAVTNKAMLALMMSWLPVAGVIVDGAWLKARA